MCVYPALVVKQKHVPRIKSMSPYLPTVPDLPVLSRKLVPLQEWPRGVWVAMVLSDYICMAAASLPSASDTHRHCRNPPLLLLCCDVLLYTEEGEGRGDTLLCLHGIRYQKIGHNMQVTLALPAQYLCMDHFQLQLSFNSIFHFRRVLRGFMLCSSGLSGGRIVAV